MDKVKGVEIDPVRERLIELIRYARYEVDGICDEQDRCDECPAENWCKDGYIADHLIASGVVVSIFETTTKWIPVTERLPDDEGTYLVCSERGAVYATHFYPKKHFMNGYMREGGFTPRGKVKATHWANLPQPPKGEQ